MKTLIRGLVAALGSFLVWALVLVAPASASVTTANWLYTSTNETCVAGENVVHLESDSYLDASFTVSSYGVVTGPSNCGWTGYASNPDELSEQQNLWVSNYATGYAQIECNVGPRVANDWYFSNIVATTWSDKLENVCPGLYGDHVNLQNADWSTICIHLQTIVYERDPWSGVWEGGVVWSPLDCMAAPQ